MRRASSARECCDRDIKEDRAHTEDDDVGRTAHARSLLGFTSRNKIKYGNINLNRYKLDAILTVVVVTVGGKVRLLLLLYYFIITGRHRRHRFQLIWKRTRFAPVVLVVLPLKLLISLPLLLPSPTYPWPLPARFCKM